MKNKSKIEKAIKNFECEREKFINFLNNELKEEHKDYIEELDFQLTMRIFKFEKEIKIK